MARNALLDKSTSRFGEITKEMEAYANIGRAISLWGSMETLLVIIGTFLLGTTPKKAGIVFYNILSFPAWLTIISELFQNTPSEYKEAAELWDKISAKLNKLNSEGRTRLAHQKLDEEKLTINPASLNYTKKANAQRAKPFSDKELSKFSKDVCNIIGSLDPLYHKLNALDGQQKRAAPQEPYPSPSGNTSGPSRRRSS